MRVTPVLVRLAAFGAMFALDGRLDVANLALIEPHGLRITVFETTCFLSRD